MNDIELGYQDDALDILKDFVFTPLTTDEQAATLDVWRGQNRSGSSAYAFDILISRFGIAVVGDVENLTFRVGISYGMPFLAGKDVSYYVHSKLDASCKKKEFDKRSFMRGVVDRIDRSLEQSFDYYPSYKEDDPDRRGKMQNWLESLDAPPVSSEHLSLLREADKVEDLHQARSFFYETPGDIMGDPSDYPSISKPDEGLMSELYLINEAARRIVALAPARYEEKK